MSDKDYFDLMQRAQQARKMVNRTAILGCHPYRKARIELIYYEKTVKEYVKEFNRRHTVKITVESYMEADT